MRALPLLVLVLLDGPVVHVAQVALVLLRDVACHLVMVPEPEDLLDVVAGRHVYRTLEHQLLSSVVEDLVNVVEANLFLKHLLPRHSWLEAARVTRSGITAFLRLKP